MMNKYIKQSILSVSLLFSVITPKNSFENFIDEIQTAITGPFKDNYFFKDASLLGFNSAEYNNICHELNNAEEIISKKQSATVDEKAQSLIITLIIDTQELTEKNVSTEREHGGVKIKIKTPKDSHSILLTGNKYVVHMRSKELFKNEKEKIKNFASNIQEITREGILDKYIDMNNVLVEVDKNKVIVTAAFKISGEENPVPVKFLHKIVK